MNLIVAVTNDWGIGFKGKLLCSLKEDMQYFRRKTMGKIVLMGQKTLESFPGGRPLKNRLNLVLSDEPNYVVPGAEVFHTPTDILRAAAEFPPDDVFVIGGASIYELFLPWCRYAYITKLGVLLEADKFFPNLDKMSNWRLELKGEWMESGGVPYCFTRYENLNPRSLPL